MPNSSQDRVIWCVDFGRMWRIAEGIAQSADGWSVQETGIPQETGINIIYATTVLAPAYDRLVFSPAKFSRNTIVWGEAYPYGWPTRLLLMGYLHYEGQSGVQGLLKEVYQLAHKLGIS